MADREAFLAYKAEKEAFVTGHKGTTRVEVFAQALVLPACILLYREAASLLKVERELARAALEFFIVVIPLVLTTTVLAEHTWVVIGSAVLLATTLAAFVNKRDTQLDVTRRTLAAASAPRSDLITHFRAGVMVLTCIAILAVDFPAFPRRFVKTETFGTSLMDIGVGAFVVSGALTGALTRDYSVGPGVPRPSACSGVEAAARRLAPAMVLGFGRLATTKGLEYQEHASEYGVHWNFFFTLGTLGVGTALIEAALQIVTGRPGLLRGTWTAQMMVGCLVLAAYRFVLLRGGLQEWILGAERVDLLTANKEGLCSTIGFIGLYMLASAVGTVVGRLRPRRPRALDGPTSKFDTTSAMSLLCALAAGYASLASDPTAAASLQESRRMANAAYCYWVLGHCVMLLAVLLLVDKATAPGPRDLVILAAINKNQLPIFLVANLCTGAVNLSIKTLHQADYIAVGVLILYMGVVCGTALAMRGRRLAL